MLFLDAASDRLSDEFREDVTAVRMGTIFASDQKQYDRWRRSVAPRQAVMDEQALEVAIMSLAQQFPDNVIRGAL